MHGSENGRGPQPHSRLAALAWWKRHRDTFQLIDEFMAAKRAKGLSDRTLEAYTYRLRIFARTCPQLPDHPEPIEGFIASTGPTPETRETYFRTIRTFYNWLLRRGHIAASPMWKVEAPLVPHKIPRGMTIAELEQLIKHQHQPKLRAFLLLIADTGIRLSEALSVEPASLREETVIVSGKTGGREVPLSPLVRVAVRSALPWPWHSHWAASMAVRRAFKAAGFTGKRASAITLRHTFARLWDGDEGVLQGIFGHTTPRMLRSVYRPYDVARAVEQHRKYTPLARLWEVA